MANEDSITNNADINKDEVADVVGVGSADTEEAVTKGSRTPKKRRKSKLPLILLILVILGIAVYMFYGKSFTQSNAVAVINGDTITQSELDARVKQVRPLLEEQGYNFEDPSTVAKLEYDVLNDLITTKLLVEKSRTEGIVVANEEIDERVNVLITQWGDEEKFNVELTRRGVSLAELKRDLSDQIAIDKLIESKFPVASYNVTDEEIESLYNMVASQQDVPPLEEVREEILNQLASQKRQTAVAEYIETIRNSSEIELLITAPDPVVPPLTPPSASDYPQPPTTPGGSTNNTATDDASADEAMVESSE